jgi:alpha-glucan,water dikinase
MEEWHQKLHNNSTPDDVVICQALIQYIQSGLDIAVYWRVLQVNPFKPRVLTHIRCRAQVHLTWKLLMWRILPTKRFM